MANVFDEMQTVVDIAKCIEEMKKAVPTVMPKCWFCSYCDSVVYYENDSILDHMKRHYKE